MNTLAPGATAPDFDLLDQTGVAVSLRSYAGQRVIVYFYPAALTPGCTIQAIDFTAHLDELEAQGVRVVGISPDPVAKLDRFTQRHHLRVRLLSDPGRGTLEAYGAWGSKLMYGKQVQGVIRSTFVIDVDANGVGTIMRADYNVRAKGHVDRLMQALGYEGAASADELVQP